MIFGALGAAPLGDDGVFSAGPGSVSLGLPFLPSGGALYAPVVSLPNGAAQSLSLPFLADTDILFSPFVARVEIPPVDRITLVAALPRAAHVEGLLRRLALSAAARIDHVEGLPRIRAPGASARIILIK